MALYSERVRVVLDTNVLIDGFSDDFSAPARLIDAVREGTITAVVIPTIEKEYRLILARLIDDPTYRERIMEFLDAAERVTPQRVDVTIDDSEDYKFLQAAVGGGADLLVTHDQHLLTLGNIEETDIVTPQEAWARFEDREGGSSGWQEFVGGLGIGRS
jgi:putative PIN family toxin of toxin-antitoxin system